jgi:hypothetical protein
MKNDFDTDEKLMRWAEERVKAKIHFRAHIILYICVNLGLVGIYFLANMGEYFWPIWCMAGWGVGLLLHGLRVYGGLSGKKFDEEIQIEYQRLKSKRCL